MKQNNIYEVCPTYESETFLLRLVSIDDAEDLLKCYMNKEAQKFFNANNCTSDFCYSTLTEMRECIQGWLDAYKNQYFIRFSVIDNSIGKAAGTIEMFGGKYGVLRIDILPAYENARCLSELLLIANHFFEDFECENIVTLAIPEATERIKALLKNGYSRFTSEGELKAECNFIKTKSCRGQK